MNISFSNVEYSKHGREWIVGDDLSVVSKADLRWYYFLGRLSISVSGKEIGPPWGWVPLFDAFCCIQQVMIFAQGGDALGRIDFTENDEFISFEFEGDDLRVTPTYMEGQLFCSVADFVTAGSEFIRDELSTRVDAHPSLARNPSVRSLAMEVGLRLPGDSSEIS
ncbi:MULTISPECIES: hypothetical protein [unclassified Streptomyces]|uniref:hypothetical protein n=1 Tax=unclassified Streptomyces TaxID=2593676 RepID=UPI003638B479